MDRGESAKHKKKREKKIKKKVPKLTREELEEKSNERIDAVTAEPLDGHKFVEISSPDGQLRLFYNTSTLIRIGTEKGRLMQPPHFREPMLDSLKQRIEELEGRKITFASRPRPPPAPMHSDDDDDDDEVEHMHMYFDQIIEEFFYLSKAALYYCPQCYEHFVKKQRYSRSVDPLDVLEALDPDQELPFMVFRYAKDWKTHVTSFHGSAEFSCDEYTFRDLLVKYRGNMPAQVYWATNARYNTVRYNRLESKLLAASRNPSLGIDTHIAFQDIEVVYRDDDADNRKFIHDIDDDDDDDDASSAEDIINIDAVERQIRKKRAREEKAAKKPKKQEGKAAARRSAQKRRVDRDDDDDDEATVSSSSSSSTEEASDDDDDDDDSGCNWKAAGKLEKRRGYICPVAKAVRLTESDRKFLAEGTKKLARAEARKGWLNMSTVRHTRYHDDGADAIDWDTFGSEALPQAPKAASSGKTKDSVVNDDDGLTAKKTKCTVTHPSPCKSASAQNVAPSHFMMDDDDDDGDVRCPPAAASPATLSLAAAACSSSDVHTVAPLPASAGGPLRFMMDDDDDDEAGPPPPPPRASTSTTSAVELQPHTTSDPLPPPPPPPPPSLVQPMVLARTFLMDD